MNGWLVLARCGIDDIVLRLYADRKLAETYANNVTEEDISKIADGVYEVQPSIFICVCILQFKDGVPVFASIERVKELADSL